MPSRLTKSRNLAVALVLVALSVGADPDVPLWLDAAGQPTADARDALALLRHAADEGLDPADYDQAALDGSDPMRFDAALSAAMLRYFHDIHMGRVDPRAIGFRLPAPHERHDFAALLRAAIAGHRVIAASADLRPPLAQYRLLRGALMRYRALAADATFAAPPPFTSAVRPGDPYSAASLLARELAAFGDLRADAATSAGRYDGELVEAVKRFQIRHGLEPDGVLGRVTVAALRVPPAARVRQIELALERLRWLPDLGDQRLIALNIPMFRLWAWDMSAADDAPALGMDVIVGRALSTQTPIFVEEMREVIFRPYWNVPPSILRHEILPKIARDPDYARREDLEITRDARGELRVRQRPGPKNSLGLIKFVFPNDLDVYMHGTPAQALFAKSRRDFSHGCVRVCDPVTLAAWVLQDRPEWTRDRIVAATNGAETIHVTLPRSIRVILFYTTAAVMPDDGTIRFVEDIYRRDAQLDRALAAKALIVRPTN